MGDTFINDDYDNWRDLIDPSCLNSTHNSDVFPPLFCECLGLGFFDLAQITLDVFPGLKTEENIEHYLETIKLDQSGAILDWEILVQKLNLELKAGSGCGSCLKSIDPHEFLKKMYLVVNYI